MASEVQKSIARRAAAKYQAAKKAWDKSAAQNVVKSAASNLWVKKNTSSYKNTYDTASNVWTSNNSSSSNASLDGRNSLDLQWQQQ